MSPLITVLIDTHNHERFIAEAIRSALEQDFPRTEMEILIVDDGSTDGTPYIVRQFEPQVRLLRKPNGGQASAFNFGIAQAKGDIVAFLDGDDCWTKRKLSSIAKAFEQNTGVAAVGHGFYEVLGSGTPLDMVIPGETCTVNLSSVEAALRAERGRGLLGTSRLSVRRRTLSQIGPVPEELVFCADAYIHTLAMALGGAVLLDQPLCYYRQHSQNLFVNTSDDAARVRRRFKILQFLLETLPPRLAELGVASEVVDAFFATDRVDLERFQLGPGKGRRRQMLDIERRHFQAFHKGASPGYALFKLAANACALLFPPRRFGQLRAWYARHNMRRFRRLLGKPEPRVVDDFVQRRPVVERQT